MIEIKEGYKNTELGEIPVEWKVAKLVDITNKIGDGLHATPKYNDLGNIPFVNGNNIKNYKLEINESTKMLDEAEYNNYKISLADNSILLSINGTIGNVGLYNNEKVLLGKSIAFINPIVEINRKYLFYTLQSNYVQKYFLGQLTGTTIRNLSLDAIRKTKVLLPSVKEQQKIAKILSSVDTQIEQTDQLIEMTKKLKKGLMQQLLTKGIGHTKFKQSEIGEIPISWKVLNSEEIVVPEKSAIKIGPFGSQLKKESLTTEGYKVYGQENVFVKDFTIGDRFVDQEKFNQLKSCELRPKDFVITMMGTIGKCAIVPEDAELGIMDSHLLRLRLDESIYLNDLLLHVINSDLVQIQMKKLSVGGIMAGLSSKVIRQLIFPVPPLKEQQKIASILSTVDAEIDSYEQEKAKYEELKKGLMQQLLTGKIRTNVNA